MYRKRRVMMRQEEWEKLDPEEKRRQLFLGQKDVLLDFLRRGAISRRQFDKSFGDLMEKMGYDENGNRNPEDGNR